MAEPLPQVEKMGRKSLGGVFVMCILLTTFVVGIVPGASANHEASPLSCEADFTTFGGWLQFEGGGTCVLADASTVVCALSSDDYNPGARSGIILVSCYAPDGCEPNVLATVSISPTTASFGDEIHARLYCDFGSVLTVDWPSGNFILQGAMQGGGDLAFLVQFDLASFSALPFSATVVLETDAGADCPTDCEPSVGVDRSGTLIGSGQYAYFEPDGGPMLVGSGQSSCDRVLFSSCVIGAAFSVSGCVKAEFSHPVLGTLSSQACITIFEVGIAGIVVHNSPLALPVSYVDGYAHAEHKQVVEDPSCTDEWEAYDTQMKAWHMMYWAFVVTKDPNLYPGPQPQEPTCSKTMTVTVTKNAVLACEIDVILTDTGCWAKAGFEEPGLVCITGWGDAFAFSEGLGRSTKVEVEGQTKACKDAAEFATAFAGYSEPTEDDYANARAVAHEKLGALHEAARADLGPKCDGYGPACSAMITELLA